MQANLGKAPMMAYGHCFVAWARFTPAASPDLQVPDDQFGITSITRLADGRWRVQLAERGASFIADANAIENDTTNLHDVRVEAVDFANGTFDVVHRTAAFGSLGSLALSNTVDKIQVWAISRIAVG